MSTWLTTFAPLRPTAPLLPPAQSQPYPLGKPDCRLFQLGRHALACGLRQANLGVGARVLVPAYHHGSEVGALAEAGIECDFYEAGPDLAPDESELEGALTPDTRALYLIHYLGFGQDARHWRHWCDARGLLLIEDVAMAWLAVRDGEPLGTHGDISFFSLWKTYGLSESAALVCARAPTQPPPGRDVHARELARAAAKWVGARFEPVARMRGNAVREVDFDPDLEFSVDYPGHQRLAGPSRLTLGLVRRLSRIDAAAVRRDHHARLLARLEHLVPAPFDALQPGSCPFAFPVEVDDKAALLRHLAARGIGALDFWATAHPLLAEHRFPEAARRRARTVALPVHQELSPSDVDRIADAVLEYERDGEALPEMPRPGQRAPDFQLRAHDGRVVSLSELRGRSVVLYFYPEAGTPGCVAQACGIRQDYARLRGSDAVVVLGISPDPLPKLRTFAAEHGLPYPLLCDRRGRVARAYGVWVRRPGVLPRRENERTTFLIDPDGKVSRVLRAVDPRAHAGIVLESLAGANGVAAAAHARGDVRTAAVSPELRTRAC